MPAPHTYLDAVTRFATEAGAAILAVYGEEDFSVDTKADDSPLTQADLASHRHLVASLRELTPETPILSEESEDVPYAERKTWDTFWLVDPLDGTKEFVKRNGEFTVNVALMRAGRPVLGVVHVPVLDVTYWASEGQGAFKRANGTVVQLRAKQSVGEQLSVVASRSHAGAETTALLENLRRDHHVEVVAKGSSLKLCEVAEGSADLYPRIGPTMEWDTAAAQCVAEGAGARVTTLTDEPLSYNKENLLNPYFVVAAPSVAALWRSYLPEGLA